MGARGQDSDAGERSHAGRPRGTIPAIRSLGCGTGGGVMLVVAGVVYTTGTTTLW